MDDLIQQGITAYKEGRRDEARNIFITTIKKNPDSEHAWGWMYQVSKNDKERNYCLQQVLRINPLNEKARQLLDQALMPPLTPNAPLSSTPLPTNSTSTKQFNSSRTTNKKRSNNSWIIASAITSFIVICIVVPITGYLIYNSNKLSPNASTIPLTEANPVSESVIKTAIAQTQAVTPTKLPTYTPTLTTENIYCSNFKEASPLFTDFADAISEWSTFLSTPVGASYDNGQSDWASFIDLAIRGGGTLLAKSWIQSTDPNIHNGMTNFMTLTQNLEMKGTKLQIKLSSVVPPQRVKLSHDKLLNCVEATTTLASSYYNFFNNAEPIISLPSLDECTNLDLYSQEIINLCNQ